MNIRKKDITVNRNYAGYWVLSTVHNGYYQKHVSDTESLKWARVEFIEKLKRIKHHENPSIKTLSRVFENPKAAKRILSASKAELLRMEAASNRVSECLNLPKVYDVRLTCLNAIDSGLHGVEPMESTAGEYAHYLNAGDSYTDTVIYWRGNYRVQSVGDFVETMERQGVRFK
ncbi:MAG: hypothetical protein Q8K24_05845 [Hydrogenophaga sp.]|nr:hypothetical protein [Hydrogenophaga sp.]